MAAIDARHSAPPARTIRECIDAQARARADATFVIDPTIDAPLSFGTLKRGADDIGAQLDKLGIAPAAKVAFLLDNGAWIVQLFLGVMASGHVAVPLNAVAGPTHLRHVLEHSDAEVVLVAPRHRDQLDEILAQVGRDMVVLMVDAEGPRWPDSSAAGNNSPTSSRPPTAADTALLLYTSGSTGLPKGAVLSHGAVLHGARNVAAGHELSAQDRALCVLPVYHINGAMVTVCAPLVSGGSVVMPRHFSASAFWAQVAKYHCTWSSVVPTIVQYLLDRAAQEPFEFGADARLAKFRFGRCASAALPLVVLQQWEKTFCVPIIETLGLTETAGTVATNPMPPGLRKAGSVGPAFGNEIKIIDLAAEASGSESGHSDGDIDGDIHGDIEPSAAQSGGDCPPNTAGEIVIRGDNVLDAYYKDPQTTAAAFVDGWFRTGDLGLLDEDGYLFITGRQKELIIRGGENIAPREIDDALYRHPAVLEAAAVGVPHADYGQEVVACVALRDGFECSAQELQAFCQTAVGKTKAPKTIHFLASLPKGPSGKILRLQLPAIIAELDA